ncbi:hypothetical protein [Nitratireductor soli]|uniref:hypothetical protein n=1 Tax=Nitratireductor soli TaxID=1670619 RepID=UPI00065E31FE|nr:hypothetical protein [Nitratireductor soli]
MAERLGEALLDIRTSDKGFDQGVRRAERQSEGLGRSFDATAAKALRLGRNLALAAAAGAAALGALVKRQIDNADAMSKSAQRAGVTTEALSRLAWAGDLSDVSLGTLTTSMGRLANVMSQVAGGQVKETVALFEALGISVTDANGQLRSADTVIGELADVFASMEDGADKTAIAIRIFGRSGAELIPLLNNGRKGLAEMADEADRLGITISTDMGRRAEAFNDAMTRVRAVFQGIVVQLAGEVLPHLEAFADRLNDPAMVANVQSIARDVVSALGTIATALGKLISLFKQLKEWTEWAGEIAPYGFFGLAKSASDAMTGGGEAPTGPQPLEDAAFDDRFQGNRPGRTSRLTPPEPPRRTFNLGEVLGGSGSGSADTAALKAEIDKLEMKRQAVKDLITQLEDEQAVMQETDPVMREMIRLRGLLAEATPEQTKRVRELITETLRERQAMEAAQDAMETFGRMGVNALSALADGSRSLEDTLKQLGSQLADLVLQAALLGQGPLAGLFGFGGGGGLFGAIGSLFSGFRATGGLIPSGTFGIVGERGPEPVIGTSRGAMVLPNSSLAGMSSGGATRSNTTVRMIMPEGWRTEIVDEARQGAADDTVRIVEQYDRGRSNRYENGAEFG